MAFLFGSWAKGSERPDSDVDIAVYFRPKGGSMEWEQPGAHYESEGEIWSDLERMLERDVGLLVLNRAAPTVAESALRGIPVGSYDTWTSWKMSFLISLRSPRWIGKRIRPTGT